MLTVKDYLDMQFKKERQFEKDVRVAQRKAKEKARRNRRRHKEDK